MSLNFEEVNNLKIVISSSYNPWYNLALEEYLLKQIKSGEVIFYLWQNQNTVVIGRNQNAWKECRCELLEKEGGRMARRLSGGGAVFHDLGNLNFTFLVDKKLYDLETQLKVILQAVRFRGIDAEFSGRNDLLAESKKFSGNAFYFSGDSAYHHGTIMVETDFNKLTKYLQVSKAKIRSKGIDSVRSRVLNLTDIQPDLTIEAVKEALENSFINIYKKGKKELNVEKDKLDPSFFREVEELYNKYSSWDWRYGETPEFDISFKNKFNWGELELGLNLKEGCIEKAVVYSDAMYSKLMGNIADSLKGADFKMRNIAENLEKIEEERKLDNEKIKVIDDIKSWLKTQLA